MERHGKRVLVVDDDDLARDLLVVLLLQAGYYVFIARNGLEALLEMTRRRFHVVISDNHMSPVSGLDFLALSGLNWPETPVVMVSGDQPDMAEQAICLGAYAWLQKPYDGDHLLGVIRAAVQPADEKHARRTPAARCAWSSINTVRS